MSRQKPMPQHVTFKELTACPQCGSRNLRKVHDQKIPKQDGIHRLVIYRCSNGHETRREQLVVRQFNVPPKKDWEGWR